LVSPLLSTEHNTNTGTSYEQNQLPCEQAKHQNTAFAASVELSAGMI